MNEKQEAEWLYAKSLELAIMLKGSSKKKVTVESVYKIIEDDYEEIAGKIAKKILVYANDIVTHKML